MKNKISKKAKAAARRVCRTFVSLGLCLALLAGCHYKTDSLRWAEPPAGGVQEEQAADGPREVSPAEEAAFDRLCEQILNDQLASSYLNLHYTFASPEDYGITDYEISFGDFSLDSMAEASEGLRQTQKLLDEIDPELLSEEKRLTYRILEESLCLELAGEGLDLYYQPLAPSNGVQAQLPILLAEFTFRRKEDVDNYLTLLSGIDEYYGQILDFEKEKAENGLFMTDYCLEQIISESEAYLTPAEQNFMTVMFDRRIDEMEGLTDEERAEYKARNLEIVNHDFIPAYELLLNGIGALKGSCTNDEGLCHFPKGKEYYEYLVHEATGTTYGSIGDLRGAISAQIDSCFAEMSDIIEENPQIIEQIDDYTFAYTQPEEILEHLKEEIAGDFPSIPENHYQTRFVPDELADSLSPAFFLVPPIDDYRNCVIYINPSDTSEAQDLYTTLAHEGFPGHMYQNTYFNAHSDDLLRKALSFTSYSEGWAVYCEYYSYTTDNGLDPLSGRLLALNSCASLGLHALLDININYFGWSRENVRDFLEPYFDLSEEGIVDEIYEAMLASPVNYLEYYVGYLEIQHMLENAQEALGDAFVLKDFHQFLLETGPAPFTVIREELRKWIRRQGHH